MTSPTTARPFTTEAFTSRDWLLLLAPAAIWGSSFLFTAEALESFEPGVVTWLRVAFGFLALLAVPGSRVPLPRSAWPKVAALGLFWMAFPLSMFPIAQQWINSSITGMLNAAMPLFTVLIGWSVFKLSTTGRRLAGVLVGFGGICFIGVPTARLDGTSAWGVILVLLAVASYGVAVNIAAPLQAQHAALPVLVRALGVALILVTPGGAVGVADSSFSWTALGQCLWLGALGTGVAFVCAATLGGRHGPVPMSVVTYFIPVVATILGVVFRDESIDGWAVIGGSLVLLGAAMATASKRTPAVLAESAFSASG